ncbi:hypothetical protein [Deinococcus sp.]|uniref:hypothetical protein n=1 Tax=Deinococcus sp. TaxID=47478 RepID=UPI0028699626|nr:hypothetical protein [Deinococcus sp.]
MNIMLLSLLLTRATNALAVILGTAIVVVVMLQAEHQGWGPLTRSAVGIAAGVITFLMLNQ